MAEKPEILDWVDEMTQPVEEHEEVKEEEMAAEPVEETPEAVDETEEVEAKDEDKKSREIDPEHVKGLEKALREEREERRKLDQTLKQEREEQRQKFERYDELWERLNKAQEEKAKESVPTYEDDPVGHLAYQNKQLSEQLQGVQDKTKQFEDYQSQQAQISQITQNIQASESNFAQQTPDYYEALNYLREVNRKTMQPIAEAQGWTEEQFTRQLGQQEFMAAANLIKQGLNPAQYAYTLASTYGYKKVESNDVQKEEEEDERKKKGLELSRSSGGSKKKIDKEFVSEASPAEFQEAMREMFGQ